MIIVIIIINAIIITRFTIIYINILTIFINITITKITFIIFRLIQ